MALWYNTIDTMNVLPLSSRKCVPCEGFEKPLEENVARNFLGELERGWELDDEKKRIRREYRFKTFKEAIGFVNRIAELAEKEQHHPNITILYNKVRITCTTHVIKGLSENDFILASKIDQL